MSVLRYPIFILSALLLGILLTAALSSIIQRQFPYVRKLETNTREAYAVLGLVGLTLLAWNVLGFERIESFKIAGFEAKLTDLGKHVDQISDQVEELFKRKKIETFDQHNWYRIRKVAKHQEGVDLEVVLEQPPIPGSIEVFDGPLPMPEQSFRLKDRTLVFLAASDTPHDNITIKYYPRLSGTSEKVR